MIKKVAGDILLSEASAIAHGIAPNDHFNQGLAHMLREQWPSMYKDFRHYCHTYHPKAGELWTWASSTSLQIINLFTQDPPKGEGAIPGKASLSHLRSCLKNLKKEIEKEGITSLALPKLATGVGGLSWSDVEPEIQSILGDSKANIFLYEEFVPGQKAQEA